MGNNYVNTYGVNIVSQSCDHTVQIVCVWRDVLMDCTGCT